MMYRLLPLLFLAVAGGVGLWYIHPTITGPIAAARAEIKTYDDTLRASERYEERRRELLSEREKLPQDGIARLGKYLPDNVDNVQLILDMDALALRSGLTISNFNTTETASTEASGELPVAGQPVASQAYTPDPANPYESLDLSITASGSYAQLRAFLDAIETSLRPLDLIEFQLTDSQTGVYKYQMTFRLYWLP